MLWICALAILCATTRAQNHTLGLADGFTTLNTPSLSLSLVKDSQTAYSLRPNGENSTFDFIPYDVMSKRDNDGQYHLGDVTFRARIAGTSAWQSGDSSTARTKVTALPVSGTTLAAANLAPTLPSDSLLNITRRWVVTNGHLQLLFDVKNSQSDPVEIGALGSPLEFNNIFTDRTITDFNNNCSFFDPYIGQDAGFVQVTPLLGTLPPLVVTPVGKSPLEGWRFLPEETSTDPFYQSQTFEGLYEWQFHTLAYAENEWKDVIPWNAATSVILQPGETRTYGLQFDVAPSIRQIEDTLQSLKRPVAAGIPGYIVPQDQVGKLFLNFESVVRSLSSSPSGALTWERNSDSLNASWIGYDVTPKAWGRSRLTIEYADGTVQTVHFYATKPATQVISDLGNFHTTEMWFDNASDPFHRSPSVLTYDREVNAPVRDDPRVWIPGLSNEAGAGSFLAAAVKQYVQPSAEETAKMELFINATLWGSVQNKDFTVKQSVYYYDPALVPNYSYPSADWSQGWSLNQAQAYGTGRAYDYLHVADVYWALYRVARNYPNIPLTQSWEWYLSQAYQTVLTMTDGQVDYTYDGLMDETAFLYLLEDLKREGFAANATLMESRMKARYDIWASERFPFGSELSWDSTGQEGVYAWSKYFNDSITAINAINSILAYQPTVPHWGYNGNARRYWDNLYGGKLMRYERQIHHYGSGLNALPLLSQFTSDPSDIYLLRVGFGGNSGPLSNIDQGGFASASFHSFADTLKWDAFSGDYGPNFVGLALGSAAYLIDHPSFGWQVFGGKVLSKSTTSVQVQVLDSVRRRIFVAPTGTLFTLDAGAFSAFSFDTRTKAVTLTILPTPENAPNAAAAPRARIVVAQTTDAVRSMTPTRSLELDAGAWVVPFSSGKAIVTFTAH